MDLEQYLTEQDERSIKAVKRILEMAAKEIGNGYFAITIRTVEHEPENFVYHHFYPNAHAFLDCKEIARGDLRECVRALGQYVEDFPKADAATSSVEAQS